MNEHMSPIPSRLYNAAVGGHVCGPEDVDFGQKVVHLVKYDRAGNEVSFESQVTQANKIYVIHDDFVLSSNITIPVNCVLEFDGGSISGAYTITGTNTVIDAGLVKIFNTNVTLVGTWNANEAYPEWFGAKGDGTTDDTNAIQKCINFTLPRGSVVKLSAKTYRADELLLGGSVTLEGSGKGNDRDRATIIQPIDTTDYVIKIDGGNGINIGGCLRNLMISGNNTRQQKSNAYNSIGVYIHKCAEFDIENVFISGFTKQGLLAEDWWDAKVSGLEIRACGDVLTYPGLQLDCDVDSTNSIHFHALHIESCPFEMYINKICSHIQFVECKFETDTSDVEQITNSIAGGNHPRLIDIYEGVYAVSFVNCFFSHNIPDGAIGILVRNNLTVIDACQFNVGNIDGTLIKNTSSLPTSYGKMLIVSNCSFMTGNNVIVCDLNRYGKFISNNVHGGKVKCLASNSVESNTFTINQEDSPVIILTGGSNTVKGNIYDGAGSTIFSNSDHTNKLDSIFGSFAVSASKPIIDFNKRGTHNFINTGAGSINFSSQDIINPYMDAEITIGTINGAVSLDTSLVPAGIVINGGRYKTFKYLYPISMWVEV